MCVSLQDAEFTGTLLYIGENIHPQHGEIRVLGYQNTPKNKSKGGNAMLLHFPAGKLMNPDNILDASKARSILKDMKDAVSPQMATRGMSSGSRMKKGIVHVFDHDIYTIVLAKHASDIPQALSRVPVDRRPELNREIFEYYTQRFPGYQYALCCFNNKEAQQAAPMFWWYTPKNNNFLELPGIDAHDGSPPKEGAMVHVNSWVFMSSHRLRDNAINARRVSYTFLPDNLKDFLPKNIVGKRFSGAMKNGDYLMPLDTGPSIDLDAGRIVRSIISNGLNQNLV